MSLLSEVVLRAYCGDRVTESQSVLYGASSTDLDYVELWEQVAVCQGQGVSIEIGAAGLVSIGVLVQLVSEGGQQVFVEFRQAFQELFFQH